MAPPDGQLRAVVRRDAVAAGRPAQDRGDVRDVDDMRAMDAYEAPGIEPRHQARDRAAVQILRLAAIEPDIFALGADPVERAQRDAHQLAAALHPEPVLFAVAVVALAASLVDLLGEMG